MSRQIAKTSPAGFLESRGPDPFTDLALLLFIRRSSLPPVKPGINVTSALPLDVRKALPFRITRRSLVQENRRDGKGEALTAHQPQSRNRLTALPKDDRSRAVVLTHTAGLALLSRSRGLLRSYRNSIRPLLRRSTCPKRALL